MSKFDKLCKKIDKGDNVTFDEACTFLHRCGFDCRIRGSHYVFEKSGYSKNISLKKRTHLLPYQINLLKEVVRYEEERKDH